MSQESFKNFCKAINNDDRIKESLKQLRKKYPPGKMSPEDTYKFIVDDVIILAKRNNYSFDFNDYIDYQMKEESGSLNDEDLFEVTGGLSNPFIAFGAASFAALSMIGTGMGIANMSQNSGPLIKTSTSVSQSQGKSSDYEKKAKEEKKDNKQSTQKNNESGDKS
ncbi:MAG: hypothetical protein LBI55_04290 [Oscillospiraceae bacterium]|jgi:hypothetical protein|nr:hypothetical protein [Oscillospiraceae bacterium]